jgi:hypothetical protein
MVLPSNVSTASAKAPLRETLSLPGRSIATDPEALYCSFWPSVSTISLSAS